MGLETLVWLVELPQTKFCIFLTDDGLSVTFFLFYLFSVVYYFKPVFLKLLRTSFSYCVFCSLESESS